MGQAPKETAQVFLLQFLPHHEGSHGGKRLKETTPDHMLHPFDSELGLGGLDDPGKVQIGPGLDRAQGAFFVPRSEWDYQLGPLSTSLQGSAVCLDEGSCRFIQLEPIPMSMKKPDCFTVTAIQRKEIRQALKPPQEILGRLLVIPQNLSWYLDHPSASYFL